ncbi:MAG: prepilin-type N-terminal cleavage/methylation domain-containing protein [Saccharofermentans sp.]|nr:prepilin-type N-terminal cleavage/methylation domain-containing protein [Saccharofermentans sp.]
MLRSKKGFTLLEMMIVTGIVVVVSGVGIATVVDSIQKSKQGQAEMQTYSNNFDTAQLGVYGILSENNAKLPAQSYTPVVPSGGEAHDNRNGEKNDDNGNGKSHENNGNGQDKDNNGNGQDKGNNGQNQDNNGNVQDKDNGKNHESNGNGWGVGTDNGHGQADDTGKVTLKANSQYDVQANTTIKSTGNRGIETLVITVPDGVTLKSVGDAGNGGRYDVKVDGNTITLQVKHDSWVVPQTSLNVNNISWSGAQNIDISYQIVYAK